MATRPELRRAARLTIPAPVSDQGLTLQPVRLIELSRHGARIEHRDPLNVDLLCFIDLPPALGRGTLSGRVVWTKVHRDEQTLAGTRQRFYRSGLTFTGLTPEQQRALATALTALQTTTEAPEPPSRQGPAAPGGPAGSEG